MSDENVNMWGNDNFPWEMWGGGAGILPPPSSYIDRSLSNFTITNVQVSYKYNFSSVKATEKVSVC